MSLSKVQIFTNGGGRNGSSGSSTGTSDLNDAALNFIRVFDSYDVALNLHHCAPIENALIDMKEDACLYPKLYSRKEYRKVFEKCSELLSRLSGKFNELALSKSPITSSPNLSILAKNLLLFLNEIAQKNDEVQVLITNFYDPLHSISSLFDLNMNFNDIKILITSLELFSRGIVVSWKPPHLISLINKVFYLLLNKFDEMDEILTNSSIQFILNLCDRNPSCVMIVRVDEYYKPLWNLFTLHMRSSMPKKSELLVCHVFLCLEEVVYSQRHGFAISILKRNIDKAFAASSVDPFYTSRMLVQIKNLTIFLLKTIKPIFTNSFVIFNQANNGEANQSKLENDELYTTTMNIRKETNTLIKMVQSSILAFVKATPILCETNPILGEILNILAIVPPSFLSFDDSLGNLKCNLEILDIYLKNNTIEYESYAKFLKIFEKVSNFFDAAEVVGGSDKRIAKFEVYFKNILLKMCLQDNDNMVVYPISYYTSCFRFMSSVMVYYPALGEDVKKKLLLPFVKDLTSHLGQTEFATHDSHNMPISICYIELLSLLANFSSSPDILNLFMACVSTKEGLFHTANCILKGEIRDIMKALKIASCHGFSRIDLVGLAKELDKMRKYVDNFPELDQTSNTAIQLKRKQIEAMLKSIEDKSMNATTVNTATKSNDDEFLLTDIVNYYKIKQEISDEEIIDLKQNIYNLVKINSQLKKTLNRETEIMENKLVLCEQKDYEQLLLQQKLDKSSKDSSKLTYKLQKELDDNKKNLEMESEMKNKLNLQITSLEEQVQKFIAENKEMNGKIVSLEASVKKSKEDFKNVSNEHKKTKEELAESKKKGHQMEAEIKVKDEEKKKICLQLERERQMVDTIRGLLGNQYKV